MLDWLKGILGDGYTDEIDRKVSAEIGKNFVAKADFNGVKAELKAAKETVAARDGQLEELKKSSGDLDALKAQIAELQAANQQEAEAHAAEMMRLKLDTAVDKALSAAGAKNNLAAKALLGDFLSGAKLSEDGSVEGLDRAVKALAEDAGTAFLFEKAPAEKPLPGAKPACPGRSTPAGQEDSGPVII